MHLFTWHEAWDETGEVVGIGDVAEQTRQTIKNVVFVLEEGGATINDVLKYNVYLTDFRDFHIMNIEFAKVFHTDSPARSTVQARLAGPKILIEIETIAYVNSGWSNKIVTVE